MLTARRTPAASYITMPASTTAMANVAEPTPIMRPVAVARPVTSAVWELGIPPAETRRLRISLRCWINSKIVLLTCANSHAITAASRIRLVSSIFIAKTLRTGVMNHAQYSLVGRPAGRDGAELAERISNLRPYKLFQLEGLHYRYIRVITSELLHTQFSL